MDTATYETLAMRTEAPQEEILARLASLGPNAMRLDNAARGLADDCGEVSGVVKKHIEYGQPLNITSLIEEVGDVLWRVAQLCKAGGFTLEQVMEANIRKLSARYPDKYSDALAAEEGRNRQLEKEMIEAMHSAKLMVHPRPQYIPPSKYLILQAVVAFLTAMQKEYKAEKIMTRGSEDALWHHLIFKATNWFLMEDNLSSLPAPVDTTPHEAAIRADIKKGSGPSSEDATPATLKLSPDVHPSHVWKQVQSHWRCEACGAYGHLSSGFSACRCSSVESLRASGPSIRGPNAKPASPKEIQEAVQKVADSVVAQVRSISGTPVSYLHEFDSLTCNYCGASLDRVGTDGECTVRREMAEKEKRRKELHFDNHGFGHDDSGEVETGKPGNASPKEDKSSTIQGAPSDDQKG